MLYKNIQYSTVEKKTPAKTVNNIILNIKYSKNYQRLTTKLQTHNIYQLHLEACYAHFWTENQ